MEHIRKLLEGEIKNRDTREEISESKPDPMLVARKYKDEYISLICALFSYGNAKQIVKFLSSLDFSVLNMDDEQIKKALKDRYYRFQNPNDTAEFFITIKRAKELSSIEDIFCKGYSSQKDILSGLKEIISFLYGINPYRSKGYEFLIGKVPSQKSCSPYKRWNMYLRWMTRSNNIDLGLWRGVDKKDLIMPLDVHTFKTSHKLGLLKRKTYDFKSAKLLTQKLKEFDANDPVKYDFAIYRLGQEARLSWYLNRI